MNRREFVALTALAALSTAVPEAQGERLAGPLGSLGSPCGMNIGCQALRNFLQDPAFAHIVTTNFNMLSAGNELKWARVRPRPDAFDFADGDWMISFAEKNHMRFHGHNLCWNVANPAWLPTVLTKENARKYLTDHIHTVAGRYAGRVHSWDVVNEPVDFRGGRPDGLRTGIWLDLLGPEYIDIAFHAAHEADPKALKVLNVYEVETDFKYSTSTRDSTLKLVRNLVQRKVPIQAVALESHLNGTDSMRSASRDKFLAELRELGLEILITEIDIDDTALPADIGVRDELVAKNYSEYLMDVIPAGQVKTVIFWTVRDGDTWLDASPSNARRDKLPHRPGLWDKTLAPKPAVAAVANALHRVCK
jgi:endo-1,4-beta-xylanase